MKDCCLIHLNNQGEPKLTLTFERVYNIGVLLGKQVNWKVSVAIIYAPNSKPTACFSGTSDVDNISNNVHTSRV